jgi:CRISP-associated protein Cas1
LRFVHFSYGGWFTAITVGPTHKNALLRIAQHRAAADPALALPFARAFIEEFRPIIADSVALSLINTGEIRPSDFIQRINAFALTERGRKVVIAAYERRMDTLIQHPVFGYRISYRRALEVQARLLGRVLSGELTTYPGFTVR